MNGLYALNIVPFLQGRWETLLSGLGSERQHRAWHCRDDRTAAQIACAGWLLRWALEQAGVEPELQRLEKTPQGKPFLRDMPQVQFSLSHGGDWVLCAVSDCPVGVDVELPRCTMDVARRFFCTEEVRAVEALEEADREIALCRLWCAKEAFVKALGGGLSMGLDSFTVELGETGAVLHQSITERPYLLHEYALGEHRICLCSEKERPQLQMVTIR